MGGDHCARPARSSGLAFRTTLWNRAELAERRCDAQLGRHLLLALPRELDVEDLKRLVRKFVRREIVGRGMVADIAFHDLGGDNPHAHVLITLRALDGSGFAARKNRDWNYQGWVAELRKRWATLVNRYLARADVPREQWIDSSVAWGAAGRGARARRLGARN